MSLKIGRLTSSALSITHARLDEAGDVSMSGRFNTDTAAYAKAFAAIFPSLVNTDEPIVPVTCDEAPHLDGFYRVGQASAQAAPDAFDHGYVDWSVSLTPLIGRGAPAVESILDTVLRTNSVSVSASTSTIFHAIPAGTNIYSDGASQELSVANAVTTATGDILFGRDIDNDPPYSVTSSWRCRPTDWYNGAATVERLWDDTWLPVIGRDAHLVDADQGWGISNGLVRMRIGTADDDEFVFECWDGGWESPTTVRFEVIASPPYSPTKYQTARVLTVIRNNPSEVRIRVTGLGIATPALLDFRLRRGSPFVEMRYAIPNSTTGIGLPYQLDYVSPTPSWTNITGGGGRYTSTADSDGNKLVQLYPIASTNTTLDYWDTALGFVTDTLSGSLWDEDDQRNYYFAASAEHVRVVAS